MKYGTPFWWAKGSLKKWLKVDPSKNRVKSTAMWIRVYVDSVLDGNRTESKTHAADMLKSALIREFITHDTVRLYIQDLDLIRFLRSTSCPQVGATKAAMNEFISKYGNVVHLLTPDKEVMSFVVDTDIRDDDTSLLAVFLPHTATQFAVKEGEGTFDDIIRAQFKKWHVLDAKGADKLLDAAGIMVNLLYYIATFPDALVDGAPTDKGGIQVLPKKLGCVVVKTHPDIVEPRAPGSRVTHFRHGHYRFLKSDRFTHKKGQFVFVKGSIVHGSTAKTVVG